MDSKKPNRPMGIPTINDYTQAQMATLLASAGVLTNLLTAGKRFEMFDEDGKVESRPELDGGVKSAAEAALIKVCDRIERMANEDQRWSLEGLGQIEKAVLDLLDSEKDQTALKTKLMEKAAAPHVVLRALVGTHPESGLWLCYSPSKQAGIEPLLGIGNTPEEACQNFDEKFYEKTNQTMDSGRAEGAPEVCKPPTSFGQPSAAEPNPDGDRTPMGSDPDEPSRRKKRRGRRRSKPGDAGSGDGDAGAPVV